MKQAELRSVMMKKGVTAIQIARSLGMSKYTMSKKMTGQNPFTWDEVVRICEILGIENPLGVFEVRK